jgi:phosphoribosylanthranilate isomerase
MPTITQIFGVEHYDDAIAVASLGAEHLGFLIEDPAFKGEGENCISAAEARRIFADLPPQTVTIALFSTPNEALILQTVEAVRPKMVQVCWDVDAMGAAREHRLHQQLGEVKMIKEVPVGGPETRQRAMESALRYQRCADLLILDTQTDRRWIGATGQTHNWAISEDIVRQVDIPCILAGGLDPDNVFEALRAVRPWGVDSYSRTNLPNGRKDLAKVRAFIDAVLTLPPKTSPVPMLVDRGSGPGKGAR